MSKDDLLNIVAEIDSLKKYIVFKDEIRNKTTSCTV